MGKTKSGKKWILPTAVLSAFFLGAASSQAVPNLEEIEAYLNHEISFVLNGAPWQPADPDGNKVDPITYDGTTYVPLRAVSQAVGVPVDYDHEKRQVILGEKRDSVPFLSDAVKLDKKQSYYTSSVTRDASKLKFAGHSYTAAFKLEDVNSNRKKLTIDFGKAYAKGHVVVAADFDTHHESIKFRVLNDKDETLYEGELTQTDPLFEGDIAITGMTRYLSVDFVAGVGGDSTGYVLLDDSWVK